MCKDMVAEQWLQGHRCIHVLFPDLVPQGCLGLVIFLALISQISANISVHYYFVCSLNPF